MENSYQFTKDPIMLGGCGRSGTTLLLSILSAHPAIYAIPYEMWGVWPTDTSEEFAELIQKMQEKIHEMEIPSNCLRWCEKTPKNIWAFGNLLDHFDDELRLIHIIRDGRDVVTSVHPSDPSKYWVTIDRWIWEVRAGMEFKDHPQVLTIRYEDLVGSFEETARQICFFINEEWTSRLLEWHLYATVRKHSALPGQIQQVFTKSVGRWKELCHKDRIDEFMANEDAVDLLRDLDYQ